MPKLKQLTTIMKVIKLLFLLLILSNTDLHAQLEVTKITQEDKELFITPTLNYPITGTYLFEGKTEPIVELNPNGTGVLQLEDLTKKNILWGIECSEIGVPIFKKGFDSSSYTLWYKNKNGRKTGEQDWIPVHFLIHFKQQKMYIFGDRSKKFILEDEKEISSEIKIKKNKLLSF